MAAADYDAVVFDLGGVLAEFGGVERMQTLARMTSAEQMWARWLSCDWVRRFERGHCPPEEFATGLVTEWELELTADEFLAEFRDWLVGPLPGAEDLVGQTRKALPVAVLSNTNQVHWDAGAHRWPLLGMFDRSFLSFEIGMVKPDPEIFSHVVAAFDTEPGRVLFLDDSQLNVDQAAAVGLDARRVVGVDSARSALVDAGII
jgi:putative hydrolase of the HAD superfamily